MLHPESQNPLESRKISKSESGRKPLSPRSSVPVGAAAAGHAAAIGHDDEELKGLHLRLAPRACLACACLRVTMCARMCVCVWVDACMTFQISPKISDFKPS